MPVTGAVARARIMELEATLSALLDAARPYLDNAAPHEQLFSGQDLRNFEALSLAVVQGHAALEQVAFDEDRR